MWKTSGRGRERGRMEVRDHSIDNKKCSFKPKEVDLATKT